MKTSSSANGLVASPQEQLVLTVLHTTRRSPEQAPHAARRTASRGNNSTSCASFVAEKPIALQDISNRMIDKNSNTSRLVDKLLDKGLVQQEACPADRRRVDIVLTASGQQLTEALKNIMDREMSSLKRLVPRRRCGRPSRSSIVGTNNNTPVNTSTSLTMNTFMTLYYMALTLTAFASTTAPRDTKWMLPPLQCDMACDESHRRAHGHRQFGQRVPVCHRWQPHSANVIVDMQTIACTDLEGEWGDKLVGHLNSDDFFNVSEHKTSSFTLRNMMPLKDASGDGTHRNRRFHHSRNHQEYDV